MCGILGAGIKSALTGGGAYYATAALTTMNPVAGLVAGCSFGFVAHYLPKSNPITLALSILIGVGATKFIVEELLNQAITFEAAVILTGVAVGCNIVVSVAFNVALLCCFGGCFLAARASE